MASLRFATPGQLKEPPRALHRGHEGLLRTPVRHEQRREVAASLPTTRTDLKDHSLSKVQPPVAVSMLPIPKA